MIRKLDQSAPMDISQLLGMVSNVASQSVFWKQAFWRVVQASFSQSVIPQIHYLRRTSFLSKWLKLYVDSKNGTKNWENVFRFSDNCIWIGSFKFFQSWTGYLSSAVNMLTNNPKISPKTRGDIFQRNFPENDEKYDKHTFMEISQVFRPLSHANCQSVVWNGPC